MRIDIITLFPQMFRGPFEESILKRAQDQGLVNIILHDLRQYGLGRHKVVDDYPYGGGQGMVLRPEPLSAAIEAVKGEAQGVPVLLLTPQGTLFTQPVASELAGKERLILVCGHYEGVDERVREHLVTQELSIGDYVLTGGELAAMVVVDAVVRLLPGVLGTGAVEEDSHASGLLEYPHYTRPAQFRGWEVPPVLLSGDHAKVARWRREQSLLRTLKRRPDLLRRADLSKEDRRFLERQGWRPRSTDEA